MGFGFLSKYFPPANFLKPSYAGISFSDFNIKVISFDKKLKDPILKSIIVPLNKGSIVAGSIVNKEDVIKKLSTARKNFDSPFVFFTMPDELAYVFSSSISVGFGGDATESVSFIMEENVPLSLNDIAFDFVPTGIAPSDSEYKASVVVAACVKKEVEKFVEVLRSGGFEPVGCIHESQAIANALMPKRSRGMSRIIHAREKRIGIYLVKDNLVVFSTLRNIIEGDYTRQFSDEFKKFSEYCSKYSENQVESKKPVLVCGEFEYAKKVVETMTDSTKGYTGDVKLSNVWTNILEIDKHLPGIPYERSLSFAGPIGATLSKII